MKDNKLEQDAPVTFWRINEWFLDLSPDLKTKLKTYQQELIKFNRTVNLVSQKSLFVSDALHFADSILASRIISESNPSMEKIYDFGSGNGFPGVIFALLYPKTQVVLVDVDQKKCEFLIHLKSLFDLKNVTVEQKNIEKYEDNSIKFAMCRGFASISKVLMATRKTVVKGGAIYHLKGEEWGMEVSEIPSQLCSLWSPSLVGEYKLPVGAVKFSIVKTEKNN